MPLPPPLLVSPAEHIDASDREAFEKNVAEIGRAEDGETISCPFPLALYHRIDGIWLPVSDLGAFHTAPADPTAKREPMESTFDPNAFVPCDDADAD